MSDEELELLETYLDGALALPEARRVERLVAREPAWAEALEQLRAERGLRQAAWASFEPDGSLADRAGRDVVRRAVQAERAARAARFARRALAVAACLLLAFAGGWAARGYVSPAPTLAREFQVALTDERGNIIAVQHFSDPRQARQFAEDVGRWQAGRRGDDDAGDFSQASDEF